MNFLQKSLLALGLLVGSLFVGSSALAQVAPSNQYVHPCLVGVFEGDDGVDFREVNSDNADDGGCNLIKFMGLPYTLSYDEVIFENDQASQLFESQCTNNGGKIFKQMILKIDFSDVLSIINQTNLGDDHNDQRLDFYTHLYNSRNQPDDRFLWNVDLNHETVLGQKNKLMYSPAVTFRYDPLTIRTAYQILAREHRLIIDINDDFESDPFLAGWSKISLKESHFIWLETLGNYSFYPFFVNNDRIFSYALNAKLVSTCRFW